MVTQNDEHEYIALSNSPDEDGLVEEGGDIRHG